MFLQVAKKAAKKAGNITEKYFGNLDSSKIEQKSKKDFVTKADKEAEEEIKKIILETFPEHGFWGEETGKSNVENEYVWVVDPIDGTTNFIHNIPLYSVSIALSKNNEIILGVVYIPKTNELFYAEKAKGAFCNDKKISVSTTKKLEDSVCAIEFWSRNDEHRKQGLKELMYFGERVSKLRYLSSTVFELCRVAKGDLDFCKLDTTFLDIAAATLLVEEAGGKCTKSNGEHISQKTAPDIMRIVASNAHLYNTLKE
ncbi:MAG: inositol monophosphatase [Candidatus Magasanikbacteria bacterium]